MAHYSGCYQPVTFESGCFKKTMEALAECWGCGLEMLQFEAHYTHDAISESKFITLSEANTVRGLISPLDRLCIRYVSNSEDFLYRSVQLEKQLGGMMVSVNTPDAISTHNSLSIITENLSLSPYELKFSDDVLFEKISEIEERLKKLEKEVAVRPMKCFLSFRFSKHSSDIAREVEQYLTLLGVKVITGSEYEPRRVEDKVRERILSGVDFVVCIITRDGESAWIRDELSTAKANNAFPIPIVEEGSEFEGGLLGNVEYIPFASGHPGDIWISLAQAVQYVSAARSQIDKENT